MHHHHAPSGSRVSGALLRIALLMLVTTAGAAQSASLTLESGSARTHLLELYTSEGCSSCPPADRWLATLSDDEALWTRVVPVAFHVTYWNYLGWRDPYAERAHDSRQRRTARRAGAGVYTPGVFRDGDEWRRWRAGGHPAGDDAVDAGILRADLEDGRLALRFEPAQVGRHADGVTAYAAWLSGATTDVTRGENRGRRLQHAFTVRHLERIPLARVRGHHEAERALPEPTFDDTPALALWVEDRSGNILQATGGWLPAAGRPENRGAPASPGP